MLRPAFRLAIVGFSLFLVGFALGEQKPVSKFAPYYKPARITSLDWRILQANLRVLGWRDHDPSFIGAPIIRFNWENERVEAEAFVDADELRKLSMVEVRARLEADATGTGRAAKTFLPEIEISNERDFYMEFTGRSWKEGKGGFMFAEFKGGKLIFPSQVPVQ